MIDKDDRSHERRRASQLKKPKGVAIYVALALVLIGTGINPVLTRLSQTEAPKMHPMRKPMHHDVYSFSHITVVFLVEFVKFVFSCVCYALSVYVWHVDTYKYTTLFEAHSLHYAVPGFLFAIDNNLGFIILKFLDAPTFSMVMQLKILIVALFMRVLLKKYFSKLRKVALFLLLLGVIVAKSSIFSCDRSMSFKEHAQTNMELFIGVALVMFGAILSSASDVYCELVFKRDRHASIHVQNMYLYMYGMFFNVVGVLFFHSDKWSKGWFYGFDLTVWAIVFNLSMAGLATSATMKFRSNIAKMFLNTLGIGLTTFLSVILFDFHLHLTFICGFLVVCCAIYLYKESEIHPFQEK